MCCNLSVEMFIGNILDLSKFTFSPIESVKVLRATLSANNYFGQAVIISRVYVEVPVTSLVKKIMWTMSSVPF
jgi:hypothetical protein